MDQLLGAVPHAAEGAPLLDHHPRDGAGGRVGDRDDAAVVPRLEDQRLVVGHALVELPLVGDPEVAPLGQVDRVAQVVERAPAVVGGRVARQLGMVLEAVDAVLQVIVYAVGARAVAAEDRLDQLVGGVELVRAVPAPERPPLRGRGDHRMKGEPDARGGDGAAHVGDVGERLAADLPADHHARVAHPVLDHVVVAERARAEDALVVRVEIVHGVDGLGVHVPARVAPRGVDREAEVLRRVAHVLVEPGAVDGGRWIADRAVIVERRLDEVVLAGAGHPLGGHRPGDVSRERRVLDVVGGGDEVLHLVVEEREVEHPVHVVAEREHPLVGAEGPQPGLPEGIEADFPQQVAQEKEQRVAPVRGIRPVPHRLHVEMRLQHATQELENLVGHVDGAVGEHDGGAQGGRGRGGGIGQIAGQLHQLGQDAAARRRLDPPGHVAGKPAHVEALPGRVAER